MDMTKLRAWWWHRQGLDGSLTSADPAGVLTSTGWARAGGSVNPYLTLLARAGTSRAEADASLTELAVHELPSARGCVYVVPQRDYGLALQVGRHVPEFDVTKAEKLGATREGIESLCSSVLEALAGGPLDPVELRDLLGDLIHNFGEAGKKKGMTTTLPVALGLLQATGEIRRVPKQERFDQQRYSYTRWSPPPSSLTDDEARVELARRYFHWTGAASMAHLRWFTAFSAKRATAVVGELGLVDIGDGLLALPEDAKSYADFDPPADPSYALLAGIDGLVLLRRDVPSLLDPADAARPIPGHPSGKPLGDVADLPDHPIVDRGRVVGLWQYDPDSQSLVWWTFDPGITTDQTLRSAIAHTETYVREQLGDARSYSLDSPKARMPRIKALRAAAGT